MHTVIVQCTTAVRCRHLQPCKDGAHLAVFSGITYPPACMRPCQQCMSAVHVSSVACQCCVKEQKEALFARTLQQQCHLVVFSYAACLPAQCYCETTRVQSRAVQVSHNQPYHLLQQDLSIANHLCLNPTPCCVRDASWHVCKTCL